ncbi:hypothetical protein [Nocardioides sp. 1609]|uniref:hypothetical protein n=1 Tax=Nocardioides sp. 1609 TaxID=2508327 RepID=UPI00106FF0CC|nr:hypothetical protein [Nocardioides sp. 1609]
MTTSPRPRAAPRARVVGVVTALLLAPVSAELLQVYLGDLGGPAGLAFLVLFLAPVYGGAVLLVREVSVRTHRGWTGRLLLAAAFGVAMPTVVDLSVFTRTRDDIDGWSDIVGAATLGGIGWSAVVVWVVGHVLTSVAAPLVVAETLARDPRPWLGRTGLGVVVAGFVLVAVALNRDHVAQHDPTVDAARYAGATAVVVALVALALSPLGRPLPPLERTGPSVRTCLVAGFVGLAAFDLTPMSWAGLGFHLVLLVAVGWLLSRWARSTGWTPRHLAAVASGGLLARTVIGFLAPLPQDTTWAEKIGQHVAYLALVLVLAVLTVRRRAPRPAAHPGR